MAQGRCISYSHLETSTMKNILTLLVVSITLLSSARGDDWPQWRGPNRDGRSAETGLLQAWPEDGPPIRWVASEIGTGYSTPSIANGRVYVQTTHGKEEFALVLDEQTGEKVWEVKIGSVGVNRGPQYPGTRSTPTVDGELVYCLASGGELVCLETATGDMKWQISLPGDLGGEVGSWAYSESVLVDGDVVVCTPGGEEATLAALDKLTGKPVWKSVVPDGDIADYASIMPVGDGPDNQYVQFLRKGLVGVRASNGEFLWRYDDTADKGANILTPVVDRNLVFSAGSRTGGGLVKLEPNSDGVSATQVYFDRKLGSSIGGAVLIDGYLYGSTSSAMFCADFKTGEIKWQERVVGNASVCYADGRLYMRGHDNEDVVLIDPSPEGLLEISRFSQPQRSETRAWPHPVVANGGFYLRDDNVLLCFDVAAS